MHKKFNLLAFPSNIVDAPCFYRCIGPLGAIRASRPHMQISIVPQISWPNMALNDAIMLQRPYTENSLQMAEMAARHGLPIWAEYDDDIFNVPPENPGYDQYMNDKAQETIREILRMADIVTVSTEPLAELVGKHAHDVHVVPNGLMTNLVGSIPAHAGRPRRRMALWRGSSTHQRDLDSYADAIVEAAGRHDGVRWVLQGIDKRNYALVERLGDRALVGKGLDIVDYFAMLASLRPRVTIVPLADNVFNRSKSNIAYIESTYAGAITIAPDWPEWRRPGVLTYRNAKEFGTRVDQAFTLTDSQHDVLWQEARDHVMGSMTIDLMNLRRAPVLDTLERMSADAMWRDTKRASVAIQ